MNKKDYSLFPRTKQKARYFYVSFRDEETGERLPAKSVDMLAKRLTSKDVHITNRIDAIRIFDEALKASIAEKSESQDDPNFFEYLEQRYWD